MLSSSRDNWERLVAAVLKKQLIWELCHQNSISTIASDDLSELTLSSFSGSDFDPFSLPPSPLHPPKIPSNSQVGKSASSRPITRNLFSALYRKMKPKDKAFVGIPEDIVNHLGQLRRFSIEELRIATRDFSKQIGSDVSRKQKRISVDNGWDVYKGTLDNGFSVAVRRKKKYAKIPGIHYEFRREVEINSIVAHPNVIRIIGFCITPTELLLVYPLMVSGSVASCIFDRDASQPPLNWATRKGIALGVARAVTYLHEELCDKKIMHCFICPANIWLDGDFEAVLADFGVAITAEHDTTYVKVDNIYGAARYISPEYYQTYRCSDKDDVYCYGIFLLVLISGQKTYDQNGIPNIKDRVKSLCMESNWEVIVDPNCASNYMEDELKLLVKIGLLCSLDDPEKRPKISEVVKMIEDEDGLADQRWEEWLKEEKEIKEEKEKASRNNIYDDTCDLVAEEFSEPR